VSARYENSLFEGLRCRQGVQLWVAERAGEMLAGGVFLYAPNTIALWHAATDTTASSLRPSNVLMGEVMLRAAVAGKSWFDFGSSGDEKLAESKRRFGARVAPFATFASASRRARVLTKKWTLSFRLRGA
jgi:CelD/BcsL family acetyltransferase involved in cellulose biosynthesis